MFDRSDTVHDVLTYVLKVWLAGLAATLFLPLAVGAAALDLLLGLGRTDGMLGRVLDASAAVETGLDVHGHRTRIELTTDDAIADREALETA